MKIEINGIKLQKLLSACDKKDNNRFYRMLHIKQDIKYNNLYTTNGALLAKYQEKVDEPQKEFAVTLVFPKTIKVLKSKNYQIIKENDNYYLQIYNDNTSKQPLTKWQGIAPDFEKLIKDQMQGASVATEYISYHPDNYSVAYEILENEILRKPITKGAKSASIWTWDCYDVKWQVLLMPVIY